MTGGTHNAAQVLAPDTLPTELPIPETAPETPAPLGFTEAGVVTATAMVKGKPRKWKKKGAGAAKKDGEGGLGGY